MAALSVGGIEQSKVKSRNAKVDSQTPRQRLAYCRSAGFPVCRATSRQIASAAPTTVIVLNIRMA